jgi:sulfite reductase alpha subunit-like flavoprotein
MISNTEEAKTFFNQYVTQPQRTLLDLLRDFPSIKLPLDHFMEVAMRSPLQYRYYSISSSSLAV